MNEPIKIQPWPRDGGNLPPIMPKVPLSIATLVEKAEARRPTVAITHPAMATGRKSNWLLRALASGPEEESGCVRRPALRNGREMTHADLPRSR